MAESFMKSHDCFVLNNRLGGMCSISSGKASRIDERVNEQGHSIMNRWKYDCAFEKVHVNDNEQIMG
jgi:hypothetical protein